MSDKYEGMVRPEKDYFQFLAEGRFMILRAKASGQYIFHPRVAEPLTGDTDLEWVEAAGDGVVYSTTVTHVRPPQRALQRCADRFGRGAADDEPGRRCSGRGCQNRHESHRQNHHRRRAAPACV